MLQITTTASENTIDGLAYNFTRSKIDYTVLIQKGCVTVCKTNNQRSSFNMDCFWDGVNNQGKQMPKFLKQVIETIAA